VNVFTKSHSTLPFSLLVAPISSFLKPDYDIDHSRFKRVLIADSVQFKIKIRDVSIDNIKKEKNGFREAHRQDPSPRKGVLNDNHLNNT